MRFLNNLHCKSGQVDAKFILFIVGVLIIALFVGKILSKSPFMVLAAVIGLTAFVLCFISFKAALFMLIFSMMLSPEFGERTTEGGGATIRLDDLLLVIIAFAWLATTAVHKGAQLFKSTPINRWIFYYVVSCVISTMIGAMFGRVEYLKGFFFVIKYIEYFVVYFMGVNFIHERKVIDHFVIAMFIVLLIVCVVAVLQIPAGGRITAPFEGKGGEPNTLGGYIVLMMSMIIGILLNADSSFPKKYKHWLIGLTVLSVIVVLFTRSRGAWLAVMPMFLTFIIISKRRYILTFCLIAFGGMFPVIAPLSVKQRVLYTFERQIGQAAREQEKVGRITLDTSTSARVSSWKDGIEAFYKHPVFGWGITGWRFLDAQYVKTMVEQGLLGLIAFLGMLYALLKESRRIYLHCEDRLFKGLAMGFFAGVIAMMVHGVSTNTFIIVRIMEPFWLLAAIVMSIPGVVQSEKETREECDESEIKPVLKDDKEGKKSKLMPNI